MEEVTSNMTIAVMIVYLTCHEVVFLYEILEIVLTWCRCSEKGIPALVPFPLFHSYINVSIVF